VELDQVEDVEEPVEKLRTLWFFFFVVVVVVVP
jgi:hypothetical protein